MQIQDLIRLYEMKTDEELIELAMDPAQLTIEANTALAGELARRRVDVSQFLNKPAKVDQISENQSKPGGIVLSRPQRAGEFVTEVLRVYHRHFRFFVTLVAPAVIVGYVAVYLGREQAREIIRHISRGDETFPYPIAMFEIALFNLSGYLVSWVASCLSFGAICVGVYQVETGGEPSVKDSFLRVRNSLGPFLRLSLLLFLLCLVAYVISYLLASGVYWVSAERHIHITRFLLFIFSFIVNGLAMLALSRFALAVPALVLDHYPVGRSIFRSDELTKSKWLVLAALLSKSLIGGYLAGMAPFWLARWISNSIYLPGWYPWVCAVFSTLAVMVIEPTMFVGFALLYLRMSAVPSTTNELATAPLENFSTYSQ